MWNGDGHFTQLLCDWKGGNRAALDALTPLVYNQLHRLAAGLLRQDRPDHTLQPTALIHEAYLRLANGHTPDVQSRSHFFALAARLMRQILVDHARKHVAGKRGHGVPNLELSESVAYSPRQAGELLALDEALERLRRFDERKCQMIELRYFAGLSNQEIADNIGVSLATVGRELRVSVAWLNKSLTAFQ